MNDVSRAMIIGKVIFGLVAAFVLTLVTYLVVFGLFNQADYNARIAKNPNQAELYYLRGCNHQSFLNCYNNPFKSEEQIEDDWKREEQLAVADFGKAIELAPDFAGAYYHRARCVSWYQFRPELAARAEADYKKAIELLPNDGWVHLDLARLYSRMNEREKALQEYKTALSLDPDDDGKDIALREMKNLEQKVN